MSEKYPRLIPESSLPQIIASEAYLGFRKENDFLGQPLSLRTPEQIQQLSQDLQEKVAHALNVDATKLRKIDPESVRKLANIMQDGGVMLMRHGPQDTKAQNKVDMMKGNANKNDHATTSGLAEFASTLLAVEYTLSHMAQTHPDKRILLRVSSSPNQRALDIAHVLRDVFGSPIVKDDWLKCPDYLDSVQLGNGHLSADGSVEWNPEDINAVFGPETYSKISHNVKNVAQANSHIPKDALALSIAITHTQQTNAADTLAGRPPSRFSNFGFILFPRSQNAIDITRSIQMSQGVFQSFSGTSPRRVS